MNRELAEKVANAVLYEGYMLYPYRPSAIKNRQRWTFGILYPPEYSEIRTGTERSRMHTECLIETGSRASVTVELRFLHLVARQVYRVGDEHNEPVASLWVDGRRIESWDEGVERSVSLEIEIAPESRTFGFNFEGRSDTEFVRDASDREIGTMLRTQAVVRGKVLTASEKIREGLWKLTIDVVNESAFSGDRSDRNAALLSSLLSAHSILTARNGEFVSLLDPPEPLSEEAGACVNVGNFPVLVGNEGERDMLLCSAILLYDYPQIAPESAGDFYDATEIDEMLTLRVMTLTDQEKAEMGGADDRARDLLERTERCAREQLAKTHGVVRNLRSASSK